MNEQTENKLPMEVTDMLNPGEVSVTEEARQQVSQLKDDANNMLMQLMLEQKAKLNEMVQQLQNPNKSGEVTLAESQVASTEVETESLSRESVEAVTPPEANVPLGDVAKLQESNMVHLDVVIDRINATMDSSMNTATTEDALISGDDNNGTANTDI